MAVSRNVAEGHGPIGAGGAAGGASAVGDQRPSGVDKVQSHGPMGDIKRVAVNVWVARGDKPTLRWAQTSAGVWQRAMG